MTTRLKKRLDPTKVKEKTHQVVQEDEIKGRTLDIDEETLLEQNAPHLKAIASTSTATSTSSPPSPLASTSGSRLSLPTPSSPAAAAAFKAALQRLRANRDIQYPPGDPNNRETGNNKTCQGEEVVRIVIAANSTNQENHYYWYSNGGIRYTQKVKVVDIADAKVADYVLTKGVPYHILQNEEDMGKKLIHGNGRVYCVERCETLVGKSFIVELEGPVAGHVHLIICLSRDYAFERWLREEEAYLALLWSYAYPSIPEWRRNVKDFPEKVQHHLETLTKPNKSINPLGDFVPLETFSEPYQEALAVQPTEDVGLNDIDSFNLHSIKLIEQENLARLVELDLRSCNEVPISTAYTCTVDGEVCRYVVLSMLIGPKTDSNAPTAHYDDDERILKEVHPDLIGAKVFPPVDMVGKDGQGRGLRYSEIPLGSSAQTKDECFGLDIVVLGTKGAARGGVTSVYKIDEGEDGSLLVGTVSSWMICSMPIESEARKAGIEAVYKIAAQRCRLSRRSNPGQHQNLFTPSSSSTKRQRFDPQQVIARNPTTITHLEKIHQFLFFREGFDMILQYLTNNNETGKPRLGRRTAKYLMDHVKQKFASDEQRIKDEFGMGEEIERAGSIVSTAQSQLAQEAGKKTLKPVLGSGGRGRGRGR
ncbi:hypothetical protein JCM3765_005426 [Sporobolomyces pararoseus]